MKNVKHVGLLGSIILVLACGGTAPTPPPGGNVTTFFEDADGDGFGNPAKTVASGGVTDNTDCDDTDNTVNPASTIKQNTNSQKDFNCDGVLYWFTSREKDVLTGSVTELQWSKTNDDGIRVIALKHQADIGTTILSSKENVYDKDARRLTYRECNSGDIRSTPATFSEEWGYDASGNMLAHRRYNGDISNNANYSQEWTYGAGDRELTYRLHNSGDVRNVPALSSDEHIYDDIRNAVLYLRYSQGDIGSNLTSSSETVYYDLGRIRTFRIGLGDITAGAPVTYAYEYIYDADGDQQTYLEYQNGDADPSATFAWEATYDLSTGLMLTYRVHENGDVSTSATRSHVYTYDDQGNMLTERIFSGDIFAPTAPPISFAKEWRYDVNGQSTAYYEYNGDITDPASASASTIQTYDDAGRELTFVSNVLTPHGPDAYRKIYDANGQLLAYREYNSGDLNGAVTSSYDYTYDEHSNPLTYRINTSGDVANAVTSSFEYEYLPVEEATFFSQILEN